MFGTVDVSILRGGAEIDCNGKLMNARRLEYAGLDNLPAAG
jgi:hypothetical protein